MSLPREFHLQVSEDFFLDIWIEYIKYNIAVKWSMHLHINNAFWNIIREKKTRLNC